MISTKNQFTEKELKMEFSGPNIERETISISVENDVNFKPVIDFLVQLISTKEELHSTFENFDEEENPDKLELIKNTFEEIVNEYNLAVKGFEDEENIQEEETPAF